MATDLNRYASRLIAKIKADFNDGAKYAEVLPCMRDARWPPIAPAADDSRHYPSADHRIEILTKNFEPIPASRKTAGQYRIAYVYPDDIPDAHRARQDALDLFESHIRPRFPLVVNDERIRQSFPRLLATRASSLRSCERKSECYFLSGERGVGKTAFINNLFSTNHRELDDKRVIWIRLDLTRAEASTMGLLEYLDVHTYDILIEKYIGGGSLPRRNSYFDDEDYEWAMDAYRQRSEALSKEKLYAWLENNAIVDEWGRELDIREFWSVNFNPRERNIRNREKSHRAKVYRQFLRESTRYAFIYVIDGLDESSIPLMSQKILEKWSEDVFKIANGKRSPHGLYIICSRQESYRDLIDHLRSSNIPHDGNEWIVWPVDFYRVVDQRIVLFKERVKRGDKLCHIEYWQGDSAKYVADLAIFCIENAFSKIGFKPGLLNKFASSGHMRALLRFFSDCIWETVAIIDEAYSSRSVDLWLPNIAAISKAQPQMDKYLRQELKAKFYRIWSVTSFRYLSRYEEAIIFDSETQRLLPPSRRAEFPLLPVPWGDIELESKEGTFGNHLLAKIRILQLLAQQAGQSALAGDVWNTIAQMYQYHPDNIRLIVREMILQRLVDFRRDQPFYRSLEESTIRLTDIGLLVLQDWLWVPDYVEHTMQLSAVPYAVRQEFRRFQIARKAGPLATRRGLTTNRYLIAMLRSMARFLAVIQVLENWERTRLTVWAHRLESGKLPAGLAFEPKELTPYMRRAVIKMAEAIVRSAAKRLDEDGNKQILRELGKEYGLKHPPALR